MCSKRQKHGMMVLSKWSSFLKLPCARLFVPGWVSFAKVEHSLASRFFAAVMCFSRNSTRVLCVARKDDDVYADDDDKALEFSAVRHGDNVMVSDDRKTVKRVVSYNRGLVLSRKPMQPGQLFQVCFLHLSFRCKLNECFIGSHASS